jgi:hypothetical protein
MSCAKRPTPRRRAKRVAFSSVWREKATRSRSTAVPRDAPTSARTPPRRKPAAPFTHRWRFSGKTVRAPAAGWAQTPRVSRVACRVSRVAASVSRQACRVSLHMEGKGDTLRARRRRGDGAGSHDEATATIPRAQARRDGCSTPPTCTAVHERGLVARSPGVGCTPTSSSRLPDCCTRARRRTDAGHHAGALRRSRRHRARRGATSGARRAPVAAVRPQRHARQPTRHSPSPPSARDATHDSPRGTPRHRGRPRRHARQPTKTVERHDPPTARRRPPPARSTCR